MLLYTYTPCFSQQKQDHNQLTPVGVKYYKYVMPFEQQVTFGVKTFMGLNSFGNINEGASELKPQFGAGVIANFKTHYHLSLRHELIFGYNRYILQNVNYSVSYPWLINYHFKHHAFVNMGIQPSLVFLENNYLEEITGNKGVTSAFEVSGVIGVEYPIDENLDFGVRVIKSFNSLLETDLPDYQGVIFSFTFYWDRYLSSERKLMTIKVKKKNRPVSARYF